MEKAQKSSHLRMVTIDEDERESLRKLAETKTTTRVTMEKNHKMVHSRLVRIDEDEQESLRRLAETSTISSINRGYHQKVKTLKNNNTRNNDVNNHLTIHDEAKKVALMPNKKLETKKSEDINESAEKFIQNFKQQLLLQRLESIENVQEMIARGV